MGTLPALCPAASAAGAARSNRSPVTRSSCRNAFAARVPARGWQWPAGSAQCIRASVFPCSGSRDLASHLTRPYWRSLALQPQRGVAIRCGLHHCDSVARIRSRTCVPRNAQCWVAGGGEALSPVRSKSGVSPRAGPGLVGSGSWAAPELVQSGSLADRELVAAGPGGGGSL